MGRRTKKDLIVVGDLLDGSYKSSGMTKRCYESHPVIEFDNGEGKPVGVLAGGNCGYPIHKDYDVYVGLDAWSWKPQAGPAYPWEPEHKSDVIDFSFRITDGSAPSNTHDAKELVTWVCNQLQKGKKVHIGCIGGHGRTGMIIAAILAQQCGVVDAIKWVRTNYCDRAVESKAQVEWLHTHFGIKKMKGSKEGLSHKLPPSGKYPTYDPLKQYESQLKGMGFEGGGYAGYKGALSANDFGGPISKINPVGSKRDIWAKK